MLTSETQAVAVIETDALTKRYARARGIEELSITVQAGEVFGFLGPNGAGKTTTIRTLLDYLHPTAGSARIFGLDSRRDSRAIRARSGNLPGDFAYDDRVTGRHLLRFCAAVRETDDAAAAAEQLAERFEADLERPLGELSRGNRQKIGLIQALFHDPELIVLDEPTSGLDPLMQEEFLSVVRERRAAGRTVFLSSHDLDEVERVCDRVAMVREGRLVAVEDVEGMRGRAHRAVAVRLADADVAPTEELKRLPGIASLTWETPWLRFEALDNLDAVIKVLARHTVADMEITRPTLEELFLTHYRQGWSP